MKEKKNYSFGASSKISDVLRNETILKQRKGSWNKSQKDGQPNTPLGKSRAYTRNKLEKGVSMINEKGSQIVKICFTGGPCAGKYNSF